MANNTVQPGDIWTIPIQDVGHFALVVARVAPANSKVPLVLAYLHMQPLVDPQLAAQMPPLARWTDAWIGLLPPRPFANGRWQRRGAVADFDPADWPVLPTGAGDFDRPAEPHDLYSIETTDDTATATVADNHPTDRETAAHFPRFSFVSGASRLESALRNHARGRRPGFWDLTIQVTPIDPDRLATWTAWAAAARQRAAQRAQPSIPAGRTTDRSVRAGHWLAMPLLGGGIGVALVVAREPGLVLFGDALLYGFPLIFEGCPRIEDLQDLAPEQACALLATSLSAVADGRWRLVGSQPNFKPADWPYPPPWFQTRQDQADGRISLSRSKGQSVAVAIPCEILDLDRQSGELVSVMHSAGSVEVALGSYARAVAGHPLRDRQLQARVTPERIVAWRRQRAAVDQALAAAANG